jgi:hypothetical protein
MGFFFRVPRVVGVRAVRVVYTVYACGPFLCFPEPGVMTMNLRTEAAVWWPLLNCDRSVVVSGPAVAGPRWPARLLARCRLVERWSSEDRAYGWSSGLGPTRVLVRVSLPGQAHGPFRGGPQCRGASRASRGVRGTNGVLEPGPSPASCRRRLGTPGPSPAPHFTRREEAQSACSR